MKITAFDGSPRKNGNSRSLLNAFIDVAAESGVEAEIFRTDELDLKACRGCLMCNVLKRCVIRKDCWEELSAKILNSDILVFSSPIYFHHTTASMKKLIDRFRSFIHVQITPDGLIHTPHSIWNKKIILLTAHGSSSTDDALPLVQMFSFMTESMGEGNGFSYMNAVRLAVSGQIEFDEQKLKDVYEKLKIPAALAGEDVRRNREYLEKAREMGRRAAD